MLINLAYVLSQPTGTTTYALNLLPHLAKLDPYYLATPASGLSDYEPVPSQMTAEQGRKGHLRRLLWTQFRLPKIYRELVSQPQVADLLFCPIPEAPLWSQCRFIVTMHDLIPLRFPESRSLTWLYQNYVPRVLSAAEHIVCNSQATADDVTRFYGISPKKMTSILLAHDVQHFRPLPCDRLPYFLVLGRHAPYKNGAIALQAFAQLPNHDDYELWFVGPTDDRYTPILYRQAADLGITANVKFLDYVPYEQLPLLLNQALALIFPSLWEGFGLPTLEAMACGTPVIASAVSAIPEVAGEAAILVEPTDGAAIAHHMQRLVQDDQLRQDLGQAGVQRAAQFSWQRTGEATVEVLRSHL
jgi:glycosyltransferase involved in cell wall biosynthesis